LKLQAKHKALITDIRARGLMIALEFNSIVNAESVYLQLIDNGFLVGQKENTLRFMPPLLIEELHIDELINTIDNIVTGT
jgi:acetylornithine/N-succinyldiaminopimelate aminotransferase